MGNTLQRRSICKSNQQDIRRDHPDLKIENSCPCCGHMVGDHENSRISSSLNKIPNYEFQRRNVTSYIPSKIIGNLPALVFEVERSILLNSGQNNLVKENLPFICIVNPPRHGKSLFLDRIFLNEKDIRVVVMTYNNNSNIIDRETLSSRYALFYFWLRFIGSVSGDTFQSLRETLFVHHYPTNTDFNLTWAKSILYERYNRNPFIDPVSMKELPLIIAVDEFSKLTDTLKSKWQSDRDNRDQFIRALNNDKSSEPLVQFVFTGFNKEMSGLMEESGTNIDVKVLSLCDFSSAKPLLVDIVQEYGKRNIQEYGKRKVPMLLFETVKSTPGLVGLWAERVFRLHFYDYSLEDFVDDLPWIKQIRYTSVEENWSLIVDYLKLLETDGNDGGWSSETWRSDLVILGNKLVLNLIGVMEKDGADNMPLLSPLCFVCIIRSDYKPTNLLEQGLKDHMKEAVSACERRPPKNERNENDGKPFEDFVAAALKTRIMLRRLNQIGSRTSCFYFSDLFPADVSRIYNDKEMFINDCCYLHAISSKANLSKMLTSPLYYLFPLGLEILEKQINSRAQSNVISVVEGASTKKYVPHFSVNLSSNCCDTKVTFVTQAVPDYQPTKNNLVALSSADSKKMKIILKSIDTSIKIILDNLSCSIFPVSASNSGCDLLLLCKESDNLFHLVAMEVKDSCTTGVSKWKDKLTKLTSIRCIVHRLKDTLWEEKKIRLLYHIVLAGREGN